ncbi:hypothetical protein FXO38_01697 [Capsicum annuum]|nr:hypothetical protein FXO38_01697 [Capsicum annuum]
MPIIIAKFPNFGTHATTKSIYYCTVAIYALFKAAIEVEVFLSRKRSNNVSYVHEITPELPRIAEMFIPLFKKWSVDYAGSGMSLATIALLSGYFSRLVLQANLLNSNLMITIARILYTSVDKTYNTEVAGNILAISCCTTVRKLGSGRVSCPIFSAGDFNFNGAILI